MAKKAKGSESECELCGHLPDVGYTDQEIVDRTNGLARVMYRSHGYEVEEGYKFNEAIHPQEQGMWALACLATEFLTGDNPDDALDNLD